jgi:hypothetical protein
MSPITNDPTGIIILINLWLTSNILSLSIYFKWISLEVINTPTARQNTIPPNSNYDGTQTLTASTPDKIIAGFPHSILPKVTGYPTFKYLKIIRQATSVVGMEAYHITEANRAHVKVTSLYRTYHNVDQAFKKLIIDAFEDPFLNVISDEVICYPNCTSLQFVSHILTYYAMISPTELTQNYEHLNTPYDPNQPIETLFQQIQDTHAFAVAGGHPYGDVIILNVSFTLVFNTILFHDDCRTWKARAVAKKTGCN